MQPSTRRPRAGRSSSRLPARRSSRIPTTASSGGSSRARRSLIVEDAQQAIAAYRELLADPAQAEEMGRRARERVLDEHTYRHRARRLLELDRARSAGLKRIAIIPAFNEQDAIGGVIDELVAFDAGVDVLVDRRRFRRCDRRARAAARSDSLSRCRSTSGSAEPCRPGSATRRNTATSSRSESTETASTIPPSSARCSTW